MEVLLNYGRGKIAAKVQDRRVAAVLRKPPAKVIADAPEALMEKLAAPIGAKPLSQLCAPGKRCCIVVSDITRPVPNQVILPPLLGYLESYGVRRENIIILIATGMHRPAGQEEQVELLGAGIVENYQVYNHNPEDEAGLVDLGRTSRGTRIQVNRFYSQADLKILTGLIEPHFMAGYSGGRKSVCPGISGLDTLRYTHGIDCLAHPAATNCRLRGNPFHEEALEVAVAAGCDFIVNAVLDEERGLTGIFAGGMEAAHQAGCEFVDRHFQVKLAAPADIVLTTGAGYPLDIDFYQTVKGLYGALPAVKKGGTIIIASRCPEGLGSDRFMNLLEEFSAAATPRDFIDAHRENFLADQWEVQKLIQVLEKAEFLIFSEGLSNKDARLGRGQKIDSIEQGLELAYGRHGPDAKVVVIPEGPYTVPEVNN